MPGLSPEGLPQSLSTAIEGRILFICGSMNQTTQMHKIAIELRLLFPNLEQCFTPYYADGWIEWCRKRNLTNFTILGNRSRERVLKYCEKNNLAVDYQGKGGPYDLVLTCADLIVPKNIRRAPLVLVQEGMTDPEGWAYRLTRMLPVLPRWFAGTALMGLSRQYSRFCVASEAYRQWFIRKGAPPEKLIVTGIPNFDDVSKHVQNDFPLRNYFLVCTSDLRETFIPEDRKSFIQKAVRLAGG
ncbi:MAG TPA: glycosyltransferase, partial [Candidatus Kapabacteria bacterium]